MLTIIKSRRAKNYEHHWHTFKEKISVCNNNQMEILDFENAEDHSKSEFYMDLEKTLSFI